MTSTSLSIAKPEDDFDLDAFRPSTPSIANVETLQSGLQDMRIADAKDFVRICPNPEYLSDELCFVTIPGQGKGRARCLIRDDIALRHLSSSQIQRHKLVLATRPQDRFFLCIVPTQNLDNVWNSSAVSAIEQAKTFWTRAESRSAEGVEGYQAMVARDTDAFQEPKWPTSQTLKQLIKQAFINNIIVCDDHPSLLRLVGAKQANS